MADATGMSHCIASNSLLQYFVNAAVWTSLLLDLMRQIVQVLLSHKQIQLKHFLPEVKH